MVVPAVGFTIIPLSDVDPDSPVTTDLMDGLRLNDQNLFAQIVGDPVSAPPFTPAAEHDHDGLNSKKIIAANITGLAPQGIVLIPPKQIITADQVDIVFSSLDGDTDESWLLITRVKMVSPPKTYELRLNADAGSFSFTTSAGSTSFFLKAWIHPRESYNSVITDRYAVFEVVDDNGTDLGGVSAYTTVSGNITSITLKMTTGGNGIANGSVATLYRLTQV